jgi:hypothetical protein
VTEPVIFQIGKYNVTKPSTTARRFSLFLWGDSGSGKTTLAATAPRPILWVNFDPDGTSSIASMADDILELDLAREDPSVVEKFRETNLNPMDLSGFIEEHEIKTVVFDSVTFFANLATNQGVTKGRNLTIERPGQMGYQFRNSFTNQAMNNLNRLTGRLGVNLIIIAHEDVPILDDNGHIVSISILIGGKMPKTSPVQVSEVWNLSDTGTERRIAVRPCRRRVPMKTRMFLTSKGPEFVWKFDADKPLDHPGNVPYLLSTWHEDWNKAGAKIPLPGVRAAKKEKDK